MVTHLSSTMHYIHVLSACICLCFLPVLHVLCLPLLHPQCLCCVPNLHSRCSQSSLAASSGNHVACAVTSLLLVLYLFWGFLFPGAAGELKCACISLHCSLNPDEGCGVVPGNSACCDSPLHEETFMHVYSDGRFVF